MKEAIYIKNVGPLVDISIDDIKPFTTIIGASASGKSTLMKVLALMRYIFKMANIRSYLKHANITKSPFRLRFNSLLHDGLDTMLSARSYIRYAVAIDGHDYTIEYKDRSLKANILINQEHLSFFKEAYIAETRNCIAAWTAQIARNRGAQLGFYFHETLHDFEQATEAIKEMPLDFVGMRLEVRKTGNAAKKYFISQNNATAPTIELKHASSGIVTATPMMTMLRYFAAHFSFKDAFQRSVLNYLYEKDLISRFSPKVELADMLKVAHLHIEEPELSLDPEAQRALINSLVYEAFHNHAPDRQVHLMLATHSPYIVNHLNVLIKAGYSKQARDIYPYILPEQIEVYRLHNGRLTSLLATDNETGQVVVDTYDMAETIDNIVNDIESIEQMK